MTTSADRSPGEWNLAVRLQEALVHLGQVGLRTTDRDEVIGEAFTVVADVLGVIEVALFEHDRARGDLVVRAAMRDGHISTARRLAGFRVPIGRGSLPGYALEQATVVITEDLVGDERFTALAPDHALPLRSAIAAPIGWDDLPVGVLVVYAREARRWSDDEVQFVLATAGTVGLAVQRSRIEEELRDSRTRLDLSLDAGGLGAWSWDLRGDRLELNAAARAMYGLSQSIVVGGEDFFAVIHPDDRAATRQAAADQLAAGADQRHVYRVIRPDTGELRWIESWGRQREIEGVGAHIVGVCLDITDRRRAEQLQEAILASEHAARVAAETARERLAFLAEASAVLGRSLDPETTMRSLADLCVPDLADVCFIDILDEEGLLQQHAAQASSEAALRDALALRRRRQELGPAAAAASGRQAALLGAGVLHREITHDQLAGAAADADHLALFERFDARSTIVQPMVARDRTIGLLTLVRTGSSRPYDADEDLPFVAELASRAALAIDNARLFHSRNRVARSLQEALLPPAVPVIDGLAIAARYHVADPDAEIGGDFYDVIPLALQGWGVVIGDVCGRGPDAAALTGLVRHTIRSVALGERSPAAVLARTNESVLPQIDDARFCTAAYLRVEVGDGTVEVVASSAGHPRPVLVRADGTAVPIECSGTLLGVVPDPTLRDASVTLAPGDAVVLFTDGVTEARADAKLFGEARSLDVLASLAGSSAEEIAQGLDAAVATFRRSARDDTAIVVVQALGRP